MASHSFAQVLCYSFVTTPSNSGPNKTLPSKCKAISSQNQSSPTTTHRRFANYKPSPWSGVFLDSLKRDQVPVTEDEKVERLKAKVKDMVGNGKLEPLTSLKLIDDIQRLDLAYHFDNDIESVLSRLAANMHNLRPDLNTTALIFRVFRQNGILMPQDEFARFKDEEGNFMSSLSEDINGMLNLYEASYLAFEGDHLLDEAKAFSKKHISHQICSIEDKHIVDYVSRTLEIPLQYRLPRLKARDTIETFHTTNKDKDKDNDLLELAKLDFNMVQAMHREELQELSIWWLEMGLANRLSFARDRLTECFFVGMGVAHQPQFSSCRKSLTKVYQVMTIIDDTYDVYGYLDELELFTNAVERWNINDVDHLPDYMKSIFFALYKTVTEIGYEVIKETGQNCIPFIKKSWEDLCKSFLVEAKWYYNGQTPTFEDYLNNGWVSSTMALGLTHAYFYVSPKIKPEGLQCLLNSSDVLRLPSTIFRLANDIATFEAELQRGETTNAISCYAKQYGVSFDDARKQMYKLIDENWKHLNAIKVAKETPFTKDFMEIAINHARLAHCLYQYGDGYGSPDLVKKRVSSLIIEPV